MTEKIIVFCKFYKACISTTKTTVSKTTGCNQMMADSYTTDSGDIQYLGLRFCALCNKEICEGQQANPLADMWVCSYCFGGD